MGSATTRLLAHARQFPLSLRGLTNAWPSGRARTLLLNKSPFNPPPWHMFARSPSQTHLTSVSRCLQQQSHAHHTKPDSACINSHSKRRTRNYPETLTLKEILLESALVLKVLTTAHFGDRAYTAITRKNRAKSYCLVRSYFGGNTI